METTVKIIDQVKEITANAVAKKQDEAKLNLPKLIEQIKAKAHLGHSECRVGIHSMNEYDKKLLQDEGFKVTLVDTERKGGDILAQYKPGSEKEWLIRW